MARMIIESRDVEWFRDLYYEIDRVRRTGVGRTWPPETKILERLRTLLVEHEHEYGDVRDLVEATVSQDQLDDMVHDLASALAANVNNQGAEEQMKWIREKGVCPACGGFLYLDRCPNHCYVILEDE